MFSLKPPVHERLDDAGGAASKDPITDPRPLRDLEQQRLCFAYLHKYMVKHTGSDTTSFRHKNLDTSSFEFALRQFIKVLAPSFQLRRTNLEEDTIAFLRHVYYPYADTVNPKTLVPIGARHNLPQQLGMLKWLAETCEQLLDDNTTNDNILGELNAYSQIKDTAADSTEAAEDSEGQPERRPAVSYLFPSLFQHSLNTQSALLSRKTDSTEESNKLSADLTRIRNDILSQRQQTEATINEVEVRLQNMSKSQEKHEQIKKKNRLYKEDLVKYKNVLEVKRAKKAKDADIMVQISKYLEGVTETVKRLRDEEERLSAQIKSTNMTVEELRALLEQSQEMDNNRAADEAKIQEIETAIQRRQKQTNELNEHLKGLLKEFCLRLSSSPPSLRENEDLPTDFLKDDSKTLSMKGKEMETRLLAKLTKMVEKTKARIDAIVESTGQVRHAYDELIMLMEKQRAQLRSKRLEWDVVKKELRREEKQLYDESDHYNNMLNDLRTKIADCIKQTKEYKTTFFIKLKTKEEELRKVQPADAEYAAEAKGLIEAAKKAEAIFRSMNEDADRFLIEMTTSWNAE